MKVLPIAPATVLFTSDEQDLYGFDPFAKTLADTFLRLSNPYGTVIALNGIWGSGKSSTVNLMLAHLKGDAPKGSIVVIRFSSWYFQGPDALALAFFRELSSGIGRSLGKKAKDLLAKLGVRVLHSAGSLGKMADAAGVPGGGIAGDALENLSGLFKQKEGVEDVHERLAKTLANSAQRFLVVIDDIDRLAPDEALLMFQLVKSAGRLPNVMYLLVFDRMLAERIVSENFPSEGVSYLEKIVQSSFELPMPPPAELARQALAFILGLEKDLPESSAIDFYNSFYDVVAPELRTPRDVVRLINALSNTWPAVRGDVNLGDYVAMETLRLNTPDIYRAVREHSDLVCGPTARDDRDREVRAKEADRILLNTLDEPGKLKYRKVLMRLFPRLEGAWSNYHYDDSEDWRRDRRICSPNHFETYFRLSPGDATLRAVEVDDIVKHAADSAYIAETFSNAIRMIRSDGGSKASLLLEEMALHADSVKDADVSPLLATLFRLADVLDFEGDQHRDFQFINNFRRLHRLTRQLTMKRWPVDDRSRAIDAANKDAPLSWLVYFSAEMDSEHRQQEKKSTEEGETLITKGTRAELLLRTLSDVKAAARGGELMTKRRLDDAMYWWLHFGGDNGEGVRAWAAEHLANDGDVLRFSRAFASYGATHRLGDRVSRRIIVVPVESMSKIFDMKSFRTRVEEVSRKLDGDDAGFLAAFLDAWARKKVEDSVGASAS